MMTNEDETNKNEETTTTNEQGQAGQEGKQGKTVCIAATAWLRQKLGSDLEASGVRMETAAKALGIEVRGFGSKGGTRVLTKRLRKAKTRKGLLKKAAHFGADTRKIARTGLKPMIKYLIICGLKQNHVVVKE